MSHGCRRTPTSVIFYKMLIVGTDADAAWMHAEVRKCPKCKRKSTRRPSTALSTAVTRLTTRRAHIVQHIVSDYTHLIARVAGFVSQRVLGPIGITPTACMNHLSPPQAALTCHPLLQSGVLGAFLCEIVSVAVAVCLYSFPGVHCQVWDPATFGVACSVTSRYCLRR